MKASTKFHAIDIRLMIASYQNHVLYCSVYIALCSYFWKSLQHGDELGKTWKGLLYIAFAFTLYALKVEVVYMINRLRLPPGDSGWPFLGHLPSFVKDAQALLIHQIQMYGPMCTVSVFMFPMVILSTEEDVQWAITQERKGKTVAFGLPHVVKLVGEEAILMKSGDAHKKLRKIFEPAFTPLAIRDYARTIDTIAQEALAKLCTSGNWQDPREWALIAMRIFFVCAFGEASEERMVKLTYLFENWGEGLDSINPFPIPGTLLHRAHYYKNELGKEMLEMVEEFKAKHPPDSEAAQKSVLGRLCYAVDEDGKGPSEQELLDNLRVFLFAGYDTTKGSFGAISTFVKENPNLELALVEEVRGLKDPLDVDELKNEAPILNAVLAETWRLAAPLATHQTIATETLNYKGYVIPKGTMVGVDLQAFNVMNDSLYPDARHFHFERWLPNNHPLYDPQLANTEKIDYNVMNSKYRPFNLGSHMCLGGHFAKLEVRIVVARLFQKYKLEISNKVVKKFPINQILSDFKLSEREP